MASIHLPSRTHAPFPPETTATDNFFTKSPLLLFLLFRLRLWRRRRRQSPPRVTKRTFRNRKGGREKGESDPESSFALSFFPDGGQKQKSKNEAEEEAGKQAQQSNLTTFVFPNHLFPFPTFPLPSRHASGETRRRKKKKETSTFLLSSACFSSSK